MIEEVPFGKFGFIKKQSIDWVKTHLMTVTGIGAFLAVGVIGISKWVKGDAQVDYLAAEMAYHHWEGDKNDQFVQLQKLIRKHPELHAKYDGAIAQKLLSNSEKGLATSYGRATLKRIGDFSPYYKDFSTCSLLIADQKLAEGLQNAKALKASMDSDDRFWEKKSELVRHGCILYAYNLLRIAMLEKVAGTPKGELEAWAEMKKNAGWHGAQPTSRTYDPEAYLLLQQNFQNQEISLLDYIKYREEVLNSSMNLRP
jgi:hypothetical protein